jgi:hypothetical protein
MRVEIVQISLSYFGDLSSAMRYKMKQTEGCEGDARWRLPGDFCRLKFYLADFIAKLIFF